MARSISASVGTGGLNRTPDVATVQELLNKVPIGSGGPTSPLAVDGKIGTKNWGRTANAIVTFQYKAFGWQDGKIDPGGKTWTKLVAYDSGASTPAPTSSSAVPPLGGSVGHKGTNRKDDVRRVQELLNQVPRSSGGPKAPLGTDGASGTPNFKLTIYAIVEFQQRNLGFNDGRIDPGGNTWKRLIAYDRRVANASPPAPPPVPPAPKPVAAPPLSEDGQVQREIDEAYREGGTLFGTSQIARNNAAWSACLQKRKRTSIQNTILAAAEHYLYARFQASSGVLDGATTAIGVALYDLFKLLPGTSHAYNWWLATQGEAPASKPTVLSMKWGAKGIDDGTADYIRAEF